MSNHDPWSGRLTARRSGDSHPVEHARTSGRAAVDVANGPHRSSPQLERRHGLSGSSCGHTHCPDTALLGGQCSAPNPTSRSPKRPALARRHDRPIPRAGRRGTTVMIVVPALDSSDTLCHRLRAWTGGVLKVLANGYDSTCPRVEARINAAASPPPSSSRLPRLPAETTSGRQLQTHPRSPARCSSPIVRRERPADAYSDLGSTRRPAHCPTRR